jgi:dynactin 1
VKIAISILIMIKHEFLYVLLQIVRERDAIVETVTDLNSTIVKFREVVQKLTDENSLLRKNLEEESTKTIPGLVESLDFKVLKKDYTFTIDK